MATDDQIVLYRTVGVPVEADGTINPAKANASWERATDPARSKSKTPTGKLKPVGEAAVGSVRETLKEQGLPAGGWYMIAVGQPPGGQGDAMALMRRVETRAGTVRTLVMD